MRLAAGGDALIRRHRRVAIDQLDAFERHAKLLGHQLDLRGGDALAELFLAGVGRHVSVGSDGDPRIQLIVRRPDRAAFELRGRRVDHMPRMLKLTTSTPAPCKNRRRVNPASRKAARASVRQRRAVRRHGLFVGHRKIVSTGRLVLGDTLHRAISFWAFSMAAQMRTCVKQRQSTPESAC